MTNLVGADKELEKTSEVQGLVNTHVSLVYTRNKFAGSSWVPLQ